MTWLIILVLVLFFTNQAEKEPRIFYRYKIENLEVIVCSKEVVNTWWTMVGGQKEWRKVHAFSYYDHKSDKYYIILPPNPSEALIGHEFKHILDWERERCKND